MANAFVFEIQPETVEKWSHLRATSPLTSFENVGDEFFSLEDGIVMLIGSIFGN